MIEFNMNGLKTQPGKLDPQGFDEKQMNIK